MLSRTEPGPTALLIHSFDTIDNMARAAGAAVGAALKSLARMKSDRIVLAVSGGSAAALVLPVLAKESAVPWQRLRVTLVDERLVPATHPASNQRQVDALLPAALKQEDRLWLNIDSANPRDGAVALSSRIPTPDVVLLGMGEDGHIASLFPHDSANDATDRFAATARPDFPRVTMTPATLREAGHIFLVFTGEAKRAVFARAQLTGPPNEIPVRYLFLEQTQVFAGP